MIRDISFTKYPREVRLAIRLAARFLTSIDVPLRQRVGHARFARALRRALKKLEDRAQHDLLLNPEGWALRIVLNFAIAQTRDAHVALDHLRQEIRRASRTPSRKVSMGKMTAG